MALRVENLSVRFGQRLVLEDVSLRSEPGQLITLLGPNGAGKTTLLRAICGLVPFSGTTSWQGQALASMPARDRAKTIAYIPQGHTVDWPLTARQTVAIGRYPSVSSLTRLSAHDYRVVENALEITDAHHLAEREVTSLSGGERARVMLARAIAVEAPVLLADEPIAALDPKHQLAMAKLLKRLAREGRTILTVLHDLAIASRIADEVVVIDSGRCVAAGAPQSVLTDDLMREVFQIQAVRVRQGDDEAILAWQPIKTSADER